MESTYPEALVTSGAGFGSYPTAPFIFRVPNTGDQLGTEHRTPPNTASRGLGVPDGAFPASSLRQPAAESWAQSLRRSGRSWYVMVVFGNRAQFLNPKDPHPKQNQGWVRGPKPL